MNSDFAILGLAHVEDGQYQFMSGGNFSAAKYKAFGVVRRSQDDSIRSLPVVRSTPLAKFPQLLAFREIDTPAPK